MSGNNAKEKSRKEKRPAKNWQRRWGEWANHEKIVGFLVSSRRKSSRMTRSSRKLKIEKAEGKGAMKKKKVSRRKEKEAANCNESSGNGKQRSAIDLSDHIKERVSTQGK